MAFKSILGAVCACLTVVSINANAVVINTLNGVNYEWLELTETAGLNRNEVEARLLDNNDVLFGYEYASRQLVEDLLLSYTSWDGLNGNHAAPSVVSGIDAFLTDFGAITFDPGTGVNNDSFSVDGFTVSTAQARSSRGLYGLTGECQDSSVSCWSNFNIFSDLSGTPTLGLQDHRFGWDATAADGIPQKRLVGLADAGTGSHLVRISSVPVPAAAWLFGSGLLGLVGAARRKKA